MFSSAHLLRNLTLAAAFTAASPALVAQAAQTAPRQLGTVKAIEGQTLTLSTTAGATVTVTVSSETPVLQLPPGSTDLKAATAGKISSVAVGDRVLVTGTAGDSATALTAARVVLMKSGAIAAQKASQQADWQRNGTGGLVKGVDGQLLTISAGAKTYKVTTTSTTIFRRYAPDSVAFGDAKPGDLGQVHAGDQISVRGPKSEDGTSITADEVVSGTFQNLSGAIASIDVSAMTVTLKDLVSKRTETVHITSNSDLRKLPAQAAAAFASRSSRGAERAEGSGAPAAGAQTGGSQEGGARRAGMDLSRMLSRLPTETLADLKPGDAVMIVASEGRGDALTAITMLSGVEPLLSAPGASSQAITLSPWTLGAPEGGGGGSQ